jgi:succinate dehydrogenase / fumarate reductase flavoprotein subunit
MIRSEASLKEALQKIPVLREEFWQNVNVLGEGTEFNQALEQAGRVADFLEFAELMCEDALERNESCGAHFRTEYQTEEGDALRNDAEFCHVAAWQYNGPDSGPTRNVEPLQFEVVRLAQRSYK